MSRLSDYHASELLGVGESLRASYRDDGALIVRRLLPVELIHDIAQQLTVLCELLDPSLCPGDTDPVRKASRCLIALEKRQPGAQGVVYDAISQTPILHTLAQHSALLQVIHEILSPHVLVHPRLIVLMSLPAATWHLARWHQDYFYNAGPETTCTVYAPLQPTHAQNGGLILVPGSHRMGLLPHGDTEHEAPSKWKALPSNVVAGFADTVQIELQPGDALFFHSLVAHTAQINRSDDARFVLNLRYRDLTDGGYLSDKWRLPDLSIARNALARRAPPNEEGQNEASQRTRAPIES